MDQKTREARRRLKAARTPRGELSPFEARGLGRKGKPHQTFPHKICSHIEGGELVYFKRLVKDKKTGREEMKNGAILKGGTPCPRIATRTISQEGIAKGYCDSHNPPKPEVDPNEYED